MTGCHIDTVRTGGRFDGNLGVLAGLEVIETLERRRRRRRADRSRSAFFTDEEGAASPPDMLGSLVYAGGLALEDALDTVGRSTARASATSWSASATPARSRARARRRTPSSSCTSSRARCSRAEGVTIGAVDRRAGHLVAGAHHHRPVEPRRHHADAPCATTPATSPPIAAFVRALADEIGGHQVGDRRARRAAPEPGQRGRRAARR